MNNEKPITVGVIACCGEGIAEGSLTRTALRMAMEELIPGKLEAMPFPLFVLDVKENSEPAVDRAFIVIDGCGRNCVKTKIEKMGLRFETIDVEELLKNWCIVAPSEHREFIDNFNAVAMRLAGEIARKAKILLEKALNPEPERSPNLPAETPVTLQPVEMTGSGYIDVNGTKLRVQDKKKIFDFVTKNYQELTDEQRKKKMIKLFKIYNRPAKGIADEDLGEALHREYQASMEKQPETTEEMEHE